MHMHECSNIMFWLSLSWLMQYFIFHILHSFNLTQKIIMHHRKEKEKTEDKLDHIIRPLTSVTAFKRRYIYMVNIMYPSWTAFVTFSVNLTHIMLIFTVARS